MSLSTIAGTSAPPVNEVGTQDTSEITPRQEFVGHTYWVTGAIHLPCGQRMMTCSLDGSLRVWNLKTGKQIGEDWRDGDWQEGDWRNGESGVWTIALSPDGEKVVSGSWDGGVRLWDTNKGKVIAKWVGHKKDVISVCWSRDGQRVLSGSFDGTAREWDVENGETVLGPIETGHKEVYAVIYSPDMTMFATAGYTERTLPPESPLKIWDSKTGELIITLRGHTDPVNHLAWTLDGKTLISGSDDHSIRTWDTTTWTQIAVLQGHTNIVYAIAISPNNRILASASADNTTRLWNLNNSQPISLPLSRHGHGTGAVACVSFSADGKLPATGCDDQNTYTWDVHAIIRKAGLDDLLLGRDKKSVHIIASATRRPVQPLKINQVPRGFFDGQPHRAHISARPDAHEALSNHASCTGFKTFFLPDRMVRRSSWAIW